MALTISTDLTKPSKERLEAKRLFEFIKAQPQQPYQGSEEELAEAMGKTSRTIRRYLRFLRETGRIEMQYHKFRFGTGAWVNQRLITVLKKEFN